MSVTKKFSVLLFVNKKTIADIFIVKGLTQPLLGSPAIKSLSMLQTIPI